MSIAASATGIGLSALQLVAPTETSGVDYAWPTISCLVNWNGDGVTFVEEHAYLRSTSITRGRTQLGDVFSAGTATITLRNESGRFSPFNPAGPLYGGVVGGRMVKLTASFQGVTYPLFVGYTSEGNQTTDAVNPRQVTLQLIDAFEQLRLTSTACALQQSQSTDQILTAILAAASWTGGTSFDVGRVLPLYAQPPGNVLQALQDVAADELLGRVYMSKSGAVVFENSTHRANVASMLWLQDVEQLPQLQLRLADIYSAVQLTYGVLSANTSGQAYRGQYGRALYPGINTVTDHLTQAGFVQLTAPVAETDYQALDQQVVLPSPPLGTSAQPIPPVDVTTSVALLSFAASGGTFTATFWNSLPYTAYLTSLAIRGYVVQTSGFGRIARYGAANSLVIGQTQSVTANALQDDAAANTYVQQRAQVVATQHPRPVIVLAGKTPTLLHQLLNLDISQRVVLQDQAGQPPQVSVLGQASTNGVSAGSLAITVPAGGVPRGASIALVVDGYATAGVTPTFSVSDSAGDSYTQDSPGETLTTSQVAAFALSCHNCRALAAGQTITVTLTGAGFQSYWSVTALMLVWPDGQTGQTAGGVAQLENGGQPASGPAAPVQGVALLVGALSVYTSSAGAQTLTPAAGWQAAPQIDRGNGSTFTISQRALWQAVDPAAGVYQASGTSSATPNQSAGLLATYSGAPARAAWLSGITEQFFVEGYTLTVTPRQEVTAQVTLFDRYQGGIA